MVKSRGAGTVRSASHENKDADKDKLTVLEAFGFTVDKSIGSGSYATVKRAYSSKHKTDVAIKIVSKRRAPADYIKKFLPREIEVVKILRHPYLVCFMQSIETTNRVYLVMELASGGDLLDEIKKNKRVMEPQAGLWFSQMAEGIDYCHRKGVAHRDLKCENVLLDCNRNLKITDFGFARCDLPFNPETNQPTLSHTFCGSYAYAPPEILTGTPYDPFKADIWSMGVVGYTMMYGRLPFDDTNHKQLVKQVFQGMTIPSHKADWVSDEGNDLLRKILVRVKTRISIDEIRANPWVLRYAKKAPVGDNAGNDTHKGNERRKSILKHRDDPPKGEDDDDMSIVSNEQVTVVKHNDSISTVVT